jgi:uncharacterized protein YqiB (DUF1249 family)
MRSFYSLEGVAKFSGLGAPTQTVRLYGKAVQQRQIDFAAASYYFIEAVAKLSWLGAPTQTVRLYGKAAQQRQIDFAAASY